MKRRFVCGRKERISSGLRIFHLLLSQFSAFFADFSSAPDGNPIPLEGRGNLLPFSICSSTLTFCVLEQRFKPTGRLYERRCNGYKYNFTPFSLATGIEATLVHICTFFFHPLLSNSGFVVFGRHALCCCCFHDRIGHKSLSLPLEIGERMRHGCNHRRGSQGMGNEVDEER